MAVFSNYFVENEVENYSLLADVDADSILADEDIETPFEESSIETAARLVAESTMNYNRIMEACAIMELNFLEENGREFIYEADGTGFFDKAKEFFLKIWEKIQALFKKAIAQFNSWFTSDKDFIRKYEKSIRSGRNADWKDKEINIYPYPYLKNNGLNVFESVTFSIAEKEGKTITEANLNADGIKTLFNKSAEELKTIIEKELDNESMEDYKDGLRAGVLATVASKAGVTYNGSTATSKEFSEELHTILQGGETSKTSEKFNADLIDAAINFLKNSEGIKKTMNESIKTTKNNIDQILREIESLKKTYNKQREEEDPKNDEGRGKKAGYCHTICSKAITFHKDCKQILMTAQGIALNTLKACSRQSKAICVKAIGHVGESTEPGAFEEDGATGLLGSIQLV